MEAYCRPVIPKGSDGIEPELCNVQYTSVDEACKRVRTLGKDTVLSKFDVKGAFRMVPVHPDDRWLLGMKWNGETYVDKVLPFGLQSAPKIYNAVADALLWILTMWDDVDGIHYLNNFLLYGEPRFSYCAEGVPVAPGKTEGPITKLVFLGIQIDTISMTLCLPPPKLERLCREIRRWETLRSCSKREFLSIIGQLQHACCVIKQGRSFLRHMIDLYKVVRELHHKVRLNAGFRSDIRWWGYFLPIWKGTFQISSLIKVDPSITLISDTSGSWGCGAFTSGGQWFQLQLPGS